jgi:hypothetical protein
VAKKTYGRATEAWYVRNSRNFEYGCLVRRQLHALRDTLRDPGIKYLVVHFVYVCAMRVRRSGYGDADGADGAGFIKWSR